MPEPAIVGNASLSSSVSLISMGEDDQGDSTPSGDSTSIPDAEQIEAFRVFRRPATGADTALPDDVAQSVPTHLDSSLARCVYSGPEGHAYVVPGQGSICFIASGEAFGTVSGETTTALAAEGGHGFVRAVRGRPVTFVGMLPAGGERLTILDRAGRSIEVPLNGDDGYWLQVSDPVGMFLTRPNGTTKQIPIPVGRVDLR